MSASLKKGIVLLLVLWLLWFLFTDPTGLAVLLREVWDALVQMFNSLISFMNTFFN